MKMMRMNIKRCYNAQNIDATLPENLLKIHNSQILYRLRTFMYILSQRTLRELSFMVYEGKLKIDHF